MSSIYSFFKNRGPVAIILAVIVSVFFVVGLVEAATTISTNISTAGTLSVTGLSSLSNTTIDGEATTTTLVISDGEQVAGHYSGGWSNLDFDSMATSTCDEQTVGVSGAEVGDTVYTGAPSTIESGLVWSAYVSSANTVTVRMCNISGANPTNPSAASWRVDVWQHTNSLPAIPAP